VVGQRHPPAALPPGKTPHPFYRRLGGPVWAGAENLAPIGIRFPDRPARSESLYRLSYPGPFVQQPKEDIYFWRSTRAGSRVWTAFYDSLNFSASGAISGVGKNFVLPARCYSTPRIYIHNIPAKLNGLIHCPSLRTNWITCEV
jgi:hypothetical protein